MYVICQTCNGTGDVIDDDGMLVKCVECEDGRIEDSDDGYGFDFDEDMDLLDEPDVDEDD